MDKGWNADRAAFVQHYATDVLDASLLRMPQGRASSRRTTRCGSRRWTRWTSELVTDSLVYRYDPERLAGRSAGLRGNLLPVHVLLRRRPGPCRAGSTRPG